MPSILFVLPVGGGSGGAHSVMQEADAMRALGVDAAIAVNEDNAARLRGGYRELKAICDHIVAYRGGDGLLALVKSRAPDVVVATTNQSVHVLAEGLKSGGLKNQRTAYYVQDYEPLFYPRGSADWLTAHASYGLVPDMIHFAKTRWLQEVVEENHGVPVVKVEPSVDHAVYFPALGERARADGPARIVAMLRPATPRRASRRTVRIMNRIAAEYGARVRLATFGCTPDELEHHSLRLGAIEHLGLLRREDVGHLMRHDADLFLDLSDFQAFGRTAIEAMSCGACAVVPLHGGAREFAMDGRNAFVVDTRSDDAIMAAVGAFMAMSAAERQAMATAAVAAGFRYTPERAALSEIFALGCGG